MHQTAFANGNGNNPIFPNKPNMFPTPPFLANPTEQKLSTSHASGYSHMFHSHRKNLNVVEQDKNAEINITWKTSSLVDSFLIEFVSSILVCLSVIFSWDWAGDNFALQFIPGIMLGLVMLCIKDEDCFFPDGSPMVTMMIWAMGGYFSWVQSCIRLLAHCAGFGVSLWLCTSSPIPLMTYHRQYSPGVYFGMEALTTAVEHIAIVYVVMPLLPSNNVHGTRFLFPAVKPKSHPDTMAPPNDLIMHAAITFSVVHWVFWRMLNCEMNPSVLILLSYLRTYQESKGMELSHVHPGLAHPPRVDHWNYCMMGLWGQFVGLAVSLVYAMMFIPRSHKYKLLSPYSNPKSKNTVNI